MTHNEAVEKLTLLRTFFVDGGSMTQALDIAIAVMQRNVEANKTNGDIKTWGNILKHPEMLNCADPDCMEDYIYTFQGKTVTTKILSPVKYMAKYHPAEAGKAICPTCEDKNSEYCSNAVHLRSERRAENGGGDTSTKGSDEYKIEPITPFDERVEEIFTAKFVPWDKAESVIKEMQAHIRKLEAELAEWHEVGRVAKQFEQFFERIGK